MPGKSRTRYISLYHAEKEISQLHDLLEAASRKEFDLLFIYDLNRFRNLMRQVFDALCDYNIQIYVYNQPREPVAPKNYTDQVKAAVGQIVDVANIVSRSEVNNFRSHFKEKMPGRIAQGLDARLGNTPYGYKRIYPGDKKHPLIIDPPKARVVVQIKDMYLAGASFKGVCKHLNDAKIKGPEGGLWYPETIRIILASPYYAGIVYFGINQYVLDRRSGKSKVIPNPSPVFGKGKHKALWDEATHQRLLEIIEERGRGYRGNKTARFSTLLYCQCKSKLHLDRRKKDDYPFWRCSSKQPGHTFITDAKATELIIPAITKAIQEEKDIHVPKEKTDNIRSLVEEIADLEKRKKKWMDLYEEDQIPKADLSARLEEIQNSINTNRSQLAKVQSLNLRRASTRETFNRLAKLLHKLPVYYMKAPAPQVNADLHAIIRQIVVTKDHTITIHWRGVD